MTAKTKARVENRTYKLHRLLSLWMFGDLTYAILPLLVLLTIMTLLGEPLAHFTELKEWSFATIVICGVVIRRFVRLKVEIQQTPASYKLDTGIQLFILLLIIAVLVLGLVILAEEGVISKDRSLYLGGAQVGLFFLAAVSLWFSVQAEDAGLRFVDQLSIGMQKTVLLQRINRELELAERHMQTVVEALDRAESDELPSKPVNASRTREEGRKLRVVFDVLDGVNTLVTETRTALERHRRVMRTPPDVK